MISQKKLMDILEYDVISGVFKWLKLPKNRNGLVGRSAGTIKISRGKKYLVIGIQGGRYSAHRLAWLYVYGRLPEIIDHKNGDSLDNSIDNLRECTRIENCQNHNKGKIHSNIPLGVRATPSGKYQSRITANKRVMHLGTFDTAELASSAYWQARKNLHYCPCTEVSTNDMA